MNHIGKRSLFFIGGAIALALGFLGIFLPLLPTTPFLLLASFCFVRSSNRVHQWLIQHPLFGSYISNYLNHGGITKKNRTVAIGFLWTSLGASIVLATSLPLRIILMIIGILVSWHLFSLRLLPTDK